MTIQIATHGFTKWEGPTPGLVRDHVQTFTKPGQAGISAQKLGIHGDKFQVTLDAKFASQELAAIAEDGYRYLVGADPVVIVFNSVNYQTVFGHRYLINNVDVVSASRHPLLVGPGFTYYGGWLLRSQWTMTPIALF